MAKDGVLRTSLDPSMASLKRELQRLVRAIVDDDEDDDEDCVAEYEAVRVLGSLRALKLKNSSVDEAERGGKSSVSVPEEFRCPISRELMRDPVILATGLTYDRPFIERWLGEGNRTCPQTQQVLVHAALTPNFLVQEMIRQWCSDHVLEVPRASQESETRPFQRAEESYLNYLLEKMSSSVSDQKDAAKELRLLTKKDPSFREIFSKSRDSVDRLINPFSNQTGTTHPDLQEDLVTTLLNLSIHENNKSLVAENPAAVALLVEALKSGTAQTRSNAAAALFTISDSNAHKLMVGNAGAIKPLVELLEEGDPQTMNDAASAVFTLCIVLENKRQAVHGGAVPAVVGKINDGVMVPELLSILALLSVHQKAVDQLEELDAVPMLLKIIRESVCEASKENCIAILHTVCYNDRVKLREIRAEERRSGSVSRLARSGTLRARRKASGILERINRAASVTHTA